MPIRGKIGSKRPIDFVKTLYNISVLFFKNFSMKEKIQKAREFLTDIAKAAASENLDGLAEILKAADNTLEALRQDAENVEVTAEAQKAKIAELEKSSEPADEGNEEKAPEPVTEETQKDAVLSVFSDSVESLLKDLAEGIKSLSDRVDNIDQALQKASQPTQSRQDEDEAEDKTITKSNRLSALNKRLGAF